MKARLKDLSFTRDGETVLSIVTREDCRALWDELNQGDVEVTVKKFRKKRSLDANAYCWLLLDKLSAVTGIPKLDLYINAVRTVGGNTEVVCVRDQAVNKLREAWKNNGVGWISETMPSKIPGCTNVILYYGSSTFDTAQMSRMIDYIVDDCKTVGIETMPPEKLEAMLESWK